MDQLEKTFLKYKNKNTFESCHITDLDVLNKFENYIIKKIGNEHKKIVQEFKDLCEQDLIDRYTILE